MDKFVHTLVNIVNQHRTEPISSSQKLYDELKNCYSEDILHHYHKSVETFEGLSALEDYKNYMQKIPSSGYLTISHHLNEMAQEIAERKGKQGRSDHQNPSKIYEMLCGRTKPQGKIGELICLRAQSSEEVCSYFLIDDGLASRKRRKMLLNSRYKYIGAGAAYHKDHEIITVILLVENLTELSK